VTVKGGTRGDHMLLGRLMAGLEVLERSGATMAEVAFDEDLPEPETVLWWCEARWKGTRIFSRHFPYPAQAVEDLLGRVLNGGMCKRCRSTTVLGIEVADHCCFMLEADDLDDETTYRYVRTCEVLDAT
jgi:hypothetical protein